MERLCIVVLAWSSVVVFKYSLWAKKYNHMSIIKFLEKQEYSNLLIWINIPKMQKPLIWKIFDLRPKKILGVIIDIWRLNYELTR